jgi:hypothetical protein
MFIKAKINNVDNIPKINEIMEQLEVDIGEDLNAEREKLLQVISDLGEEELYKELSTYYIR